MKIKQLPRGTSEQEDGITGAAGQLRADMERGEIRLHDNARQGGFRIPNMETVQAMIAARGDDSATGTLQVFATQTALADVNPDASVLAVVIQSGLEDLYIWKPDAAGTGDIASNVDGSWHRVTSQTAMAIRLWSMGLFTMQVGGVEPATDQDTTAWLDGGIFKTWDGADYVATTPATFARLLAEIGGYTTTSFVLPDSLASSLVEITDLDDADDSGWYKSSAAAANAPVAGVHPVEHRKLSATVAIQTFNVLESATLARYVRYMTASTWSAWVLALDVLPARLGSEAAVVADANSANESGFYKVAAASANVPEVFDGTIMTTRYSSTSATQIWQSLSTGHLYVRTFLASAWGAWRRLMAGDQVGQLELVLINVVLAGTVKLNGALLSRTTYWELFAKWGTTYGAGDGVTTFGIKDVRGEFPRFWADSGGIDGGRVIGSSQAEMIGSHTHTFTSGTESTTHGHALLINGGYHGANGNAGGSGVLRSSSGDQNQYGSYGVTTDGENTLHTHSGTTAVNSGTENRVRNVAFLALVRYE